STDVLRQAVPDALKDGASQPCILQSEVAYEQRQERRRVWQQQSGISLGHIVEPNVIERAYVLAPPADRGGARYDDMTRGLSVAAEAQLITHEPDAWTAAQVRAESRRLHESLAARARAEQVRQARVSAELHRAAEHDVQRDALHGATQESERV